MNVQLVLLRQLAADFPLKPGTILPARVLDRSTIALAGARMAATLPEGLEPGQALRVRVREVSHEKLLLQIVDQPAAAEQASSAVPLAATAAVPLPGGASARLLVDPDDEGSSGAEGGDARRSITLRYESPGLGRLDLALSLDPGVVSAIAHAPADVAERLREGVPELRSALGAAANRPAQVVVVARQETLNVQA
jgi:hypothetical protein